LFFLFLEIITVRGKDKKPKPVNYYDKLVINKNKLLRNFLELPKFHRRN